MPFEIGHSTMLDSVHLYLHFSFFLIAGIASFLHLTNLKGVVGFYHNADVAGRILPAATHTYLFKAFCEDLALWYVRTDTHIRPELVLQPGHCMQHQQWHQ